MLEKIELEQDEAVLATVRKHWFVIFSELVMIFIMVLTPLFILLFLVLMPEGGYALELLMNHLTPATFVLTLWLLFSILIGFTIWTHYYLDLWIVTDRRIIVIDQVHFFNRKVSSFRLERLQDVKAVINGVLATFLNYGTLHVHTAGNMEENFTTSGLPDPRGLQALIQKATDTRLQNMGRANHLEP